MAIYREKPGKGTDQLQFRIHLVKALFVKYANTVEHKVPRWLSSDNTVSHLTEGHFISKIPQTEKKPWPQR
jgi:hypothetical protein